MNDEIASTTVRDAVFQIMRDMGATKIFGNPGSTELPMFRDFPDDFDYVLGLQEAVVMGMADGYAQATRNVAFANLHSAAGVGNAMGNIYTAFKNRSPIVIIAGQQSRSILQFDPYLASPEATELPKPYVKWSCEPARAEDVPQAVARACHIALQAPRGPVLVSIPADDWDQHASFVAPRRLSHVCRPDPALIEECARHLNAGTKPALVVGAEIDHEQAWSEIVELAERMRVRVFVAPFSGRCSFPEDHPQFAGFLPPSREAIVSQLSGHDVIFVVGAPVFTYHIEGQGPFIPPGASLYHLTEDEAGAARAAVGTSIVGNVRLGLKDLLACVHRADRPLPGGRRAAERVEPGTTLSTAYVLQALAEWRKADDVFVEEAPTARVVMHSHLPMLRPDSFYTMSSGGLGHGMPAAAGVAYARNARVICVIGDGSSMYSIQTLWTAAQHKLKTVYVVLNNGKYAAMKRFGGILGFPAGSYLPGTDLPGIDFAALAQAQGCQATRASTAAELAQALADADRGDGPFLIEVVVD